jgi:hypothetical protein
MWYCLPEIDLLHNRFLLRQNNAKKLKDGCKSSKACLKIIFKQHFREG